MTTAATAVMDATSPSIFKAPQQQRIRSDFVICQKNLVLLGIVDTNRTQRIFPKKKGCWVSKLYVYVAAKKYRIVSSIPVIFARSLLRLGDRTQVPQRNKNLLKHGTRAIKGP